MKSGVRKQLPGQRRFSRCMFGLLIRNHACSVFMNTCFDSIYISISVLKLSGDVFLGIGDRAFIDR